MVDVSMGDERLFGVVQLQPAVLTLPLVVDGPTQLVVETRDVTLRQCERQSLLLYALDAHVRPLDEVAPRARWNTDIVR